MCLGTTRVIGGWGQLGFSLKTLIGVLLKTLIRVHYKSPDENGSCLPFNRSGCLEVCPEAFFLTVLWVVIDDDVSLTDRRRSSFGDLLL
jgi:hypothetical protein